jgi:hypothetical protein
VEYRKTYFPQFNGGGLLLIIATFFATVVNLMKAHYFFSALTGFFTCLFMFSHQGIIIRKNLFVIYYSFLGIKIKSRAVFDNIVRISVVHRKFTYRSGDGDREKGSDFAVILRTDRNKMLEASVAREYKEVREDAVTLSRMFDVPITDLVKKNS